MLTSPLAALISYRSASAYVQLFFDSCMVVRCFLDFRKVISTISPFSICSMETPSPYLSYSLVVPSMDSV